MQTGIIFIKMSGVICVMMGCGGTGLAVGRSCRKRIEQMRQMRQSLLMLHGEIRYTGAELPEAISETAGRCGKPFSDFYETLSEQMRQMTGQTLKILWQECAVQYLKQTCLTKEDQKIFLDLGNQMGYLDSQMQLSALEGCMALLEDRMTCLEKSLAQKQKLSMTLGILSGFFVMVLLI